MSVYDASVSGRVDREAGRDITIDGVRIEKGMLVHIAIAALHRDPEAWPEPWRFIPERSDKDRQTDRHTEKCQHDQTTNINARKVRQTDRYT